MTIQNITVIAGQLGEHITDYAKRCYDVSQKEDMLVQGKFNGAIFDTRICNSADDVLGKIEQELQKNQDAYKKTDEYKNMQTSRQQRANQQQIDASRLEKELDKINWKLGFTTLNTVLAWLCDMQKAADNIAVTIDREKIINTFKENGFLANVNTGDYFDENNQENVARYIIGQALDGFKRMGVPHQVLLRFVEDWKKNPFTPK